MSNNRIFLKAIVIACLFLSQNVWSAFGDFQGSATLGAPFSTPVGLENNGSGNLLITDIGGDFYTTINAAGTVVGPVIDLSLLGINPLGIATDGTLIYVTDTSGLLVAIFNAAGVQTGSFSVASETTFPEGITVGPNGTIFVVDGAGGNTVYEYTPTGTLVNNYPVLGSSPDGLTYDFNSCSFWLYDSGTDTVRHYDQGFNELQNFPGTSANGFANGEGLAVAGNTLYVVATGSRDLVSFDIGGQIRLCVNVPIPTLGKTSTILMVVLLLGVAFRRRHLMVGLR